jgi:uncharacterized protein YoxC
MKGSRIMKKIEVTLHLSTLVAAIAFVAGCILVVQGIKEVKLAEIKESAIQGCLEVGVETFTYEVTGTSAQVPSQKTFEDCMQKKGY